MKMYEAQGEPAPSASIVDLTGQNILIPRHQKQVLVFWATWCGPCRIELGRINRMIIKNEINANDILAVSISEDPKTVTAFVREHEYHFQVAVDETGKLARLYKVFGTPTILLIDQDGKVNWMTTGLSPALEFRLKSFLIKQ